MALEFHPEPEAATVTFDTEPAEIEPQVEHALADFADHTDFAEDGTPTKTTPNGNGAGVVARSRRAGRTNIFEAQVAPLNPVEALLEFFRSNPKPHQARDLVKRLPEKDLERLGGRKGLEQTLERLVRERQLVQPKRHTFALPKEVNLIVGRFGSRVPAPGLWGYGLVAPETPGLRDLLVAPRDTLAAWQGDRVVAREETRKGDEGPRGKVIRILERARHEVVGTLEYSKGYAILRPDENRLPRLLLLPDGTEKVRAGARLIAQLHWPEQTGEDEPFGRIREVIGDGDNPEVETRAVVHKFGLRDEFSDAAALEAKQIPLEIPESALEGRSDLRSRRVFTIDGRDAKDFDDAIHIEPLQNGHFLVGVHVADVSHYVQEGGALDEEAKARATSVYLPGQVLPMLPEKLSNGVCSLVPNQDRLAMSVLLQLNADGDVVNTAMVPSVIHSRARLTYDEVQAFSEAKAAMPDHARDLEGDLHLLLKLTTRVREKRFRDGSLDFRLREVKVDVAPDGTLSLIPVREETARGLIEDLMLLANRTVAEHFRSREIPSLFRIHDEPAPQRFLEVTTNLGKLGIAVPGGKPTPQAYQEILASVRGTPQEGPVNTLLLRSLKQAKYSSENRGHFGLAFKDYLHFTSPIRRYPDLIVHRALKASLARKLGDKRKAVLEATLPALADHVSERERNAADAERDLTRYYQCRWALDHVGEGFKGTVTGLTSYGMFVALENGVEGLVGLDGLRDDQYSYLEDAQMVRGRSSGRMYRLGSTIRVRIESVNPVARQIDLAKEMEMTKSQRGPARRNEKHNPRQASNDRRVVVLHGRPKGEHSRPVRVTARRLYFGEWSRANMEGEEGQEGFNPQNARPAQARDARQDAPQQRDQQQRPNGQQPRRDGQERSQPQGQRRFEPRGNRPQGPRREQAVTAQPLEPNATERNQNRAQRGPAEGRPAQAARPVRFAGGAQPARPANLAAQPASPSAPAGEGQRRRRRRRRKPANPTA